MYPNAKLASLGSRHLAGTLSCAALLLIASCSTRLANTDRPTLGHTGVAAGKEVVAVAKTLIGAPYQYGGTTPDGFDCSGLVHYAYKEAGLNIPRTTREQLRYAQRVRASNLRPGDVLFFRVSDRKVTHVGIYTGDGRFIHAPSAGGHVAYARMDNPFWEKRLVGAGRLY
jgi:murein DD-endopeptidase